MDMLSFLIHIFFLPTPPPHISYAYLICRGDVVDNVAAVVAIMDVRASQEDANLCPEGSNNL